MSDKKSDSSNKPARAADRLQHELLVAYRHEYRTLDSFITDWAVNISKGGVFINRPDPLPVGTKVQLLISLPGAAFPFDLTGKVVRVAEQNGDGKQVPGMAIEFVDVDEEKRSQIERFVDRLRQELPDELVKSRSQSRATPKK